MEGIKIPIGADLSDLQAAFAQVNKQVAGMSAKISSSLEKSNAAFTKTSKSAELISKSFAHVWQAVQAGAAAAFRGMEHLAAKTAHGIGSAFKSVASIPGKLLGSLPMASLGGLAGIGGAVALAVKSIGKSAEMETLETAFAPLLGGAAKAQARIAELSHFAAVTPFELPEIASASRALQVLTNGALATGKGLTLVGDVASGVNGSFEEISVTIGRLYDGLQSGRPVGEAMQRLQELGVISGAARGKIEALQKAGAKGNIVWQVAEKALGRFSGSMERQSLTWTGLMSTFQDAVSMAMAALGKPIMDSLKPWLTMAITKVESLKSAAAGVGASIGGAFNAGLAAWQTGSISRLLMDGLELAFVSGINTFMAGIQGGMAFLGASLKGILGALGDGLAQSGFLGVFNDLASVMGSTISAAVLSSIGKVTGWAGWEKDAGKERAQANFSMGLAKDQLGNLDFNGAFEKMLAGLKTAWDAGKKAQGEATSKPFVDDSKAAQGFVETMAGIKAQMAQNAAELAKSQKAMDDKLKGGPSKPEDPAAAVAKAAGPAVMSLTRVGGGGFAQTAMNGALAESKKHTALLKKIADHITRPAGAKLTASYA